MTDFVLQTAKYEKSCQHLMDNCHSSKCRLMIFTTFLNIGRSPVSPVSPVSTSWKCWPVTRPPGEDTATATRDRSRDILVSQWSESAPGPCLVTRQVFITIYGNRIRADLELNIDGSDWVGCAGQMENNKSCRKFLKSQKISVLTLCFFSQQDEN